MIHRVTTDCAKLSVGCPKFEQIFEHSRWAKNTPVATNMENKLTKYTGLQMNATINCQRDITKSKKESLKIDAGSSKVTIGSFSKSGRNVSNADELAAFVVIRDEARAKAGMWKEYYTVG